MLSIPRLSILLVVNSIRARVYLSPSPGPRTKDCTRFPPKLLDTARMCLLCCSLCSSLCWCWAEDAFLHGNISGNCTFQIMVILRDFALSLKFRSLKKIQKCQLQILETQKHIQMQNFKFRKYKQGQCEELCPGIDARGGANKVSFLRKSRNSINIFKFPLNSDQK